MPAKTYAHAVARRMIMPLINTPVTPNHLTALRLLSGLLAAYWFSLGEYVWTFMGGLMFLFSNLLDRADGELARLSNQMTQAGDKFDVFSDMAANVFVFIGIGFGLVNTSLGNWAAVMGLVSGISVALTFLLVLRLHNDGIHMDEVFVYPNGFDYDDALFLITVFAWLDALQPFLIAASIGAPVFLLITIRRARQQQGQGQ